MKIAGKILSVILSIVFVIVLLVFGGLIFGKNFLDVKFYQEVLEDISLEEIKVEDLGIEEIKKEYGSDASLQDVVVDTLVKEGIDEKIVNKVIESSEVKEVASQLISDYVNYKVNDGVIPQVSTSDVTKLLEIKEVQDVLKEKGIDANISELVDKINSYIKGGIN